MPAGLAPEIAHFVTKAGPSFGEHLHMGDMVVKANDAHHLQRPETVESLFVLYRLTKNETYREWGWKIFERWQAHCKVSSGGYASLDSVLTTAPRQRDKMESFFLAETLKYLFLLFSDDPSLVPLDRYVLSCCHLSNPARHAARCTGRHASAMPACMGHCHTVMGSINLRL
jgi:mannosyl-oligosaccharide alpha-1,2-mannosidase